MPFNRDLAKGCYQCPMESRLFWWLPIQAFDIILELIQPSYELVTGLDGSPIITTGATYARFMPNIIAFGPSFPGQIGIAHNHNEYMFVDDLKRNIEIYRLTLDELLR